MEKIKSPEIKWAKTIEELELPRTQNEITSWLDSDLVYGDLFKEKVGKIYSFEGKKLEIIFPDVGPGPSITHGIHFLPLVVKDLDTGLFSKSFNNYKYLAHIGKEVIS